jgi:hypothetical protein
MAEDVPGTAAWTDQTSAFGRIQSVASTVTQPHSAVYIATEARVPEDTVRDHLDRLVDLTILLTEERDGTTLYYPDPLYTRLQTVRDLLDEHDRESLVELKTALQSQTEGWQNEYGVESPDKLRARAAEAETSTQTREIRQTANEWDLVRYCLAIINDAIDNYELYNRDFQTSA